jgi:DNA gyrase subunit A
MFATASGGVRRNKLSDFGRVRSSGLIAMKLDEGDHLVGVATCREGDDVLLATRKGRCIRFQVTDEVVRVFTGRDSAGVRGIRLGKDDDVISLSVLRHVDASMAERAAYLKAAVAKRRAPGEDGDAPAELAAEESEGEEGDAVTLSPERFDEMEAAEELLLTITNGGFGKRSSAYEYRVTGRGGQGITNITLAPRNGTEVAGTFPVRPGTDVMLVTNLGKLIRVPGDQVRITGRQAMGVTLFRVEGDERVTAVFPVVESVAELDDEAALPPAGAPGEDGGEDSSE